MHILLLILPYALQLLCIIHIFKTGRSTMWIYVLIFLPGIGGIAYLLVEILPGLRLEKRIPEITDIVASRINPSRKIAALKKEADFTPSFNNKKALADEYLASGLFREALDIYDELLQGADKDNTSCLLMKAKALYGLREYPSGAEIIARLDELGFSYDREWEILIKLKILEHTLGKDEVDDLYRQARKKFSSFEINYYFTEYLIEQNNAAEAQAVIDEVKSRREYLRKNKITFDKTWADRAAALQGKLKK